MAESRLQRWARKKAETSKDAGAPLPATDANASIEAHGLTAEPAPSSEEQELAANEALPEQDVLAKYNLPDPDAIELGTDITGFMRKEIPELLRRRALRALWRSNPVLAVLDGLNDYDEDYSNAATTVKGVQTLYKVGQGMFDKKARAEEQLNEVRNEQVVEQVAEQAYEVPAGLPEGTPEIEPEEAAEKTDERSELENPVQSSHNQRNESVTSAAETEPAPRYRPRMRFE